MHKYFYIGWSMPQMIRSIPFPSRSMLWQAPAAVSSGVPELRLPWLSRARK